MKKFLGIFICILLTVVMVSGCAATTAAESPSAEETQAAVESAAASAEENATDEAEAASYTIGVAFNDLSNPTWAEMGNYMVEYGKDQYNADVILVGADNNSATQVSQIENFIQSGVDAIIVGAVDVASVEEVTKTALESDIPVYAYGYHITNYTAELMVANYDTGYAIGEQAANWINEKLGGEAEVGLIDYPVSQDLIERENGMKDALAELAPGAEIVATGKAATTAEGMTVAEDFLQAHPNMKVIVSVGDGGATGSNEAVKAAGLASDDWGIFSCDATQQACQQIKNGESERMTISLGGPKVQGGTMIDTTMAILQGEDYIQNDVMTITPITQDNVDEYAESMGWTLD